MLANCHDGEPRHDDEVGSVMIDVAGGDGGPDEDATIASKANADIVVEFAAAVTDPGTCTAKSEDDVDDDEISDGGNQEDECEDSDNNSDTDDVDEVLPFPGFVPTAFYYFDQTTQPRQWCLQLITWPWFERLSMCVILLNCITLGMYRPCHDDVCRTVRCQVLEGFDHFIFAFFAVELCIKAFAMGLFGRGAYLADSWNRLDTFIVLAGAIEYAISMEDLNLSAIRTIRVLRPLRAINRIPSMRILVTLLLDTLPMLGNILLLCFFVFFIFGIVGVQLWSGNLRQRCFLELPDNISLNGFVLPSYYGEKTDTDFICSNDDGMTRCNEVPVYRYQGHVCNRSIWDLDDVYSDNTTGLLNASTCVNWNTHYTSCRPGPMNPFHGSISFDNIGLAWIAIFQVISLAGWVNIMYFVQDAHSFWDWIYFVALIVIGSFFMVNLCLVVIATQFSETKKRETERMWLERRRCASSGTLASVEQLGGCYDEIIRYIGHLGRVLRRRMYRLWRLYGCYRRRRRRQQHGDFEILQLTSTGVGMEEHGCGEQHHTRRLLRFASESEHGPPEPDDEQRVGEAGDTGSHTGDHRVNGIERKKTDASKAFQTHENERGVNGYRCDGSGDGSQSYGRKWHKVLIDDRHKHSSIDEKETDAKWFRVTSLCPSCPAGKDCWRPKNVGAASYSAIGCCRALHSTGSDYDDDVSDDDRESYGDNDHRREDSIQKCVWQKICESLKKCVESSYFQRGILGAILINTLSMGIEYHNQPDTLTKVLEYSNLMFSSLFAIEMLLKVFVEGPFGYIKSGFNLFDGFIVILSLVELIQGGTGGLSVLRTFRLLRILKLVRFMPALRVQLVIMLKTMDNVATFFSLLVLFIFIFSVLGMHLFGGKFCVHITEKRVCNCSEVLQDLCKCDRKNFDTLQWSIVTVFQILTQEDWQEVLYSGMSKTSQWSALYFIALMTFGNYVLFNLLVAILVEGFSAEGEAEDEDEDTPAFDVSVGDMTVSVLPCADETNSSPETREHETPNDNAVTSLPQFDNASLVDDVFCKSPDDITTPSPVSRVNGVYLATLALPHSGMRKGRSVALSSTALDSGQSMSGAESGQIVLPPSVGNSDHSLEIVGVGVDTRCNSISTSRPAQRRNQRKHSVSAVSSATARYDQNADGNNSSENGSILSPLKHFGPRRKPLGRTSLTPHNSFQSYFRPSIVPRVRKVDSVHDAGVTSATETASGSPSSASTTPSTVASTLPQQLTPRRQVHREMSFRQVSRPNGVIQVRRAPSVIGTTSTPSSSYLQRRMSNYDRSATRLSRRNTVVGGGPPLSCPPPPPLSLLDIYRLSRQGSIRSRHNLPLGRRSSTQSRDESKGGAGQSSSSRRTSSKASVSRRESSRSRADGSRSTLVQCPIGVTVAVDGTPSQQPRPSIETSVLAQTDELAGQQPAVTENEQQVNEVIINAQVSRETGATGSENITAQSRIRLLMKRIINMFSFRIEQVGCLATRLDFVLFIFPPSNRLHQACCRLLAWHWFDNLILIFIVLNCITLAMERPNIPTDSVLRNAITKPWHHRSQERHFLNISNSVFTVIFAAEMAIKVIAKGLLYGHGAYLRSGWNIMDGGLVLVSLIDIFVSLTAAHSPRIFGILRVFRLLRTLRPLRPIQLVKMKAAAPPSLFEAGSSQSSFKVISRAPGLKLVVQTLLSSLRPIGNIVIICIMFFIIFGILGVQLFKGSFYYCDGPFVADVITRDDCLEKVPRELYKWKNREYNFDDLGQALMALFVLASKDGWVSIMYSGLDAVGVNKQPKINHNEWCLIYFISFLLLVGFFVLNMFVGVVVENFHKCRETQESEEKAMHAARRAKKLARKRKRLRAIPYWSKYSKGRLLVHTITNSKYFDLAIAGVIGVNVVTMAMEYYMMPKELQFALKIFNFFFTSVFVIEALVKIIAQGFIQYFSDKWNQLDMAIVILSIAGIVLEEMKSGFIPINPTIIRVMRVLRIARVLKLLKMAKSVRTLLNTVVQALPEVGNLALLFFLLFFIFAALGVELFGRIECSVRRPCEGLGKHAHFHNFGMAFLTLFRVATGDNWNGILKDTLRPDCDNSDDCEHNCCVSHVIATVYFVIFVLMAQFVLVNVVVAVLMKHLEESNKYEDEDNELDIEIRQEFENSNRKVEATEDLPVPTTPSQNSATTPTSRSTAQQPSTSVHFTNIDRRCDPIRWCSDPTLTRSRPQRRPVRDTKYDSSPFINIPLSPLSRDDEANKDAPVDNIRASLSSKLDTRT